MDKTALIFGVTGQDGALLARFLLEKSYRVIGSTRGIEKKVSNLERLKIHDQVEMVSGIGFRHIVQCLSSYRPREVYNLSAQSSEACCQQIELSGFKIHKLSGFSPSVFLHFQAASRPLMVQWTFIFIHWSIKGLGRPERQYSCNCLCAATIQQFSS